MATKIVELIAELTKRAKTGLNFADNMVLRALDFSEVRDKLQSLLDQNYSLIGAEPLPSGVETLSQVLFRLRPPPGTAALDALGIVIMFERSSNKFVSASDVVPIGGGMTGFGAVPFAMGAPSFVRATVRPTSDPANARMQDRRANFWRDLRPTGQPAGERGGTPVGCWESYTYGTAESYDTNGQKDWHTVDDEGKKWVYDDIANDVYEAGVSRGTAPRAMSERDPASGTPVGCWESYTYGTAESYDTNGQKDWHTVDDEGKKWVYDDITADD
jgi:hypothetical protein